MDLISSWHPNLIHEVMFYDTTRHELATPCGISYSVQWNASSSCILDCPNPNLLSLSAVPLFHFQVGTLPFHSIALHVFHYEFLCLCSSFWSHFFHKNHPFSVYTISLIKHLQSLRTPHFLDLGPDDHCFANVHFC